MRADLSRLDVTFRKKLELTLSSLKKAGYIFIPYCSIRDPYEQAKLWRRSRTAKQVQDGVEYLTLHKADFLLDCLTTVGPQPLGPWATNALPGFSWHQWGEAVDCYLDDGDGGADWHNMPAYDLYAHEARNNNLIAGHFWSKKDSVHLQARIGQPYDMMSISKISEQMENRYGQ